MLISPHHSIFRRYRSLNYHHFSAIRHAFLGLSALILLQAEHAVAAPLRLAVVLSEQGGAYQEYSNALRVQLVNKNIVLSVTDSDQPLPDADLVVAAGMKAALNAARTQPAAMLAVLIPKEGFARLLNDFPAQLKDGSRTLSAIYLDQPIKRQLDLINSLLPTVGTIGVLYTAPPKELQSLRTMAAARKIEINERSVSSASNMHSALQELLISSDVLLALPDAEIYNVSTIRNILLATYRNKVPLIGFSAGYVRAGALGAVFSTPGQIAAQTLNIINEYAEKRELPAAQYAKEFEVLANEQVARSLGLNIKNESQIRIEIGTTP